MSSNRGAQISSSSTSTQASDFSQFSADQFPVQKLTAWTRIGAGTLSNGTDMSPANALFLTEITVTSLVWLVYLGAALIAFTSSTGICFAHKRKYFGLRLALVVELLATTYALILRVLQVNYHLKSQAYFIVLGLQRGISDTGMVILFYAFLTLMTVRAESAEGPISSRRGSSSRNPHRKPSSASTATTVSTTSLGYPRRSPTAGSTSEADLHRKQIMEILRLTLTGFFAIIASLSIAFRLAYYGDFLGATLVIRTALALSALALLLFLATFLWALTALKARRDFNLRYAILPEQDLPAASFHLIWIAGLCFVLWATSQVFEGVVQIDSVGHALLEPALVRYPAGELVFTLASRVFAVAGFALMAWCARKCDWELLAARVAREQKGELKVMTGGWRPVSFGVFRAEV